MSKLCSNALKKRNALDHTMVQHRDDLGTGPFTDLEWTKVSAEMNFLWVPRQVMESLAANRKSSLDLVQLRIAYLIKHCETKEVQLQDIDYHEGQVGAVSDKACAASCNCGGILESANPQAIRPSKLHQLKDRTHAMLREHYADKMKIYEPA
jgi:hypothetical protein